MKVFGRIMTALAIVATLLVICVVAMPTVVGYGVDSLFWDVWGKVYTGDSVRATVRVNYVDAPSADAAEQDGLAFTSDTHVVDASGLEVYEVHPADPSIADYAAAFSEGAGLISAQGSEGSARVLTYNDQNGPMCIWRVTLNSTLHPMLPEGDMQVYFAVKAPEDQLVDLDVTIWIRAQAAGDPVVQVQVATEGRSENGPHDRSSVTADWGKVLINPAK